MSHPFFPQPSNDVTNVSPGSSITFKPRVNRADFGDGYTQRSGDGLNANPATLSANFDNLLLSEAETIMTFLESRKGYLPFLFLVPGETKHRQFICTEWRKDLSGAKHCSVSANFEESFDP